MKCTSCKKNEATVFYREIINGKETKYALCPECAKEKDISMTPMFDLPDIFGTSLLSGFFTDVLPSAAKREEKKCTLCGSTFKELCERGKVGCPVCYSVFREELRPTMTRLHGGATHRGRLPSRFKAEKSRKDEISRLEAQLKSAVAEERYEDAAVLRDRLNILRER